MRARLWVHSDAPRDRLVAIAAMQFVCICLIVARHYSHYLAHAAPSAMTLVGRIDFSDFFFVSSGYLIHRGARGRAFRMRSFLGRRMAKLYPLHLATTLVFVAAALAGVRGSLNGETLGRCVAANVTMLQATGVLNALCLNYPAWFLGAIMAMYLAYPLLAMLVERAPRLAAVLAVAIVAGLSALPGGGPFWTSWTFHFGVLRALPSFLAGMILARVQIEDRVALRGFAPAWACFAASIATMASGRAPLIGNIVLQIAMLIALATAERNGARGVLTRALLGRLAPAAFPLFLLHAPVAAVIVNIAAIRVLHLGGAALALAVLGSAVGAVLLARLFVMLTGRPVDAALATARLAAR